MQICQSLIGGRLVTSYNIFPLGLHFGWATYSGFGRENSINPLDAYREVKSVHITLQPSAANHDALPPRLVISPLQHQT